MDRLQDMLEESRLERTTREEDRKDCDHGEAEGPSGDERKTGMTDAFMYRLREITKPYEEQRQGDLL